MKARRFSVLLIAAGVCAAAGAAAWWWRAGARAETLTASVPPRPVLGNFPAELRNRIDACEQLLKNTSDSRGPTVLAELGQLYQANGFLPEAVTCYGGLTRLDPANPRWPHRLACIYAGFGQLDEALGLWQRTIARAPDYLPARIRMGDVLLKLNRGTDAADAYAAVLAREPGNPYALVGLARIDLAAGRWSKARERLELASAGSDFSIGADLLATVCEQLGDAERAAALRARAKSSGAFYDPPDPWMDEIFEDCLDVYRLTVAAGFADHAGNAPAAQHLIERALTLAPDNAAALYQSGTFAMQRRDYEKARQDFEACVREDAL